MTVGNCIKTFLASSSVLQRRVRGAKVSSFGLDLANQRRNRRLVIDLTLVALLVRSPLEYSGAGKLAPAPVNVAEANDAKRPWPGQRTRSEHLKTDFSNTSWVGNKKKITYAGMPHVTNRGITPREAALSQPWTVQGQKLILGSFRRHQTVT
jgi:hypothetical protein